MRFIADERELITDDRLARSYVAGLDEAPSFTRAIRSGDQIVVERPEDGSGNYCVPWPVGSHGDWLLATATLTERERPYLLEVELARGLVFRVRDQLAAWQLLGLQAPDELTDALASATRAFSRAAVRQHSEPAVAAAFAREALTTAGDAACELAETYAEQALALRRQGGAKLTSLLGVRLNGLAPSGAAAPKVAEAFNLAIATAAWRAVEPSEGRRDWGPTDRCVEWAQKHSMRVCVGPLLEFDERGLPDWAYLWEGDVDRLLSLMTDHVTAAVERYKGQVHLWHVASRINRDRVLSLSDEKRLNLVANAVATVRRLDPGTPVIVGVDQPWGEYRARRQTELSPIDFADALERADLGIAGFELEMNIGYQPGGTELRNPLAFSRLIDYWNVRLESPLMLSIRFPSGHTEAADGAPGVVAGGAQPGLLSAAFQADWARRRLPMLLAKNAVQVVAWSQIGDADGTLPLGGLFDTSGVEKPAFRVLSGLRKELLA
ncbi:MAG: endo-1,4-beta-xylanase [Planctomycetota bacterium]